MSLDGRIEKKMKYLVILLLLFVTACCGEIKSDVVYDGIKQCESNGGLYSLTKKIDSNIITVKCVNGARFLYYRDELLPNK